MNPEDKRQLKWLYDIHKDRLTMKERALMSLALDNWTVGQIAKFTHVEAPIVLHRLKRACRKLW